jgi:RNA polymerase sigma-70 factor (ECF subfamily)
MHYYIHCAHHDRIGDERVTMADPKPPDLSDAINNTPLSLLERLRANEPAAWQRCMNLYAPLVRFWCTHRGLSGPDVEDVTQEVFAASAVGLSRFHRDRAGDTFRGWLRGITRNQIAMHFRRNQDQAHAAGGSDAWEQLQTVPDPLAGLVAGEDAELGQLYRRALEQVRCEFSDHVWQAFWLTAVEGRLPSALVEELKMTVNHIRQAKARVLRRLREELGDLLD